MHDARLEDFLRQTLREEGSRLPLAISTDLLERRLADRRRTRDKSRWLSAAAVALVAVGTTAAVLAWAGRDDTTVTATPAPSLSAPSLPTPTLPAPEALLAQYPEAVLLLEQSVGPADGPAALGPSESSAPIEIGTVTFDGPFVIGIACLGGGDMVVEVSSPRYDFAYTTAVAECDGNPISSEYFAPPIDPESTGDTVTVSLPEGRSWRLAIGGLPMSLIEPPSLAPIARTADWNLLSDVPATQLTEAAPRTGARLTLPRGTERVGVFVQCSGAGTASVTFGREPVVEVPCDPEGVTHRLEFPATGGEVASLEASADRPGVWVRLIVETDARITTAYPSAPPMPAAVAAAPYVVPDPNVVGLGTIGGSEQRILEIGGALPGRPSGDLLPVGASNEADGAALYLVSIESGDVVRTLASVPAPAFIIDSWADEPHGRVYYGIATESGLEFRSVAVDGSDDRILATVGRDGLAGVTADLALDRSTLVVDACHTGAGCVRTILDTASGRVRTIDRAAGPICRILGIVDDLIIGVARATCTDEGMTALVAVPIDGEPRVVLEDAPREVADGVVVRTTDGAKLVYVGEIADDGSAVTPVVLDVETGTTSDLPPGDVGDPRLGPYAVALPDGWLLLAGGAMGDFPWQRALDRPTPVLLNLETGRRIELPNLPHWTGYLSGS